MVYSERLVLMSDIKEKWSLQLEIRVRNLGRTASQTSEKKNSFY